MDINDTLLAGFTPSDDLADKYAELFKIFLKTRFKREDRKGTLRMSNAGKPCERQVYYDVNSPEDGEELRSETLIKFAFGDMTELFLLFLVEASGHKVEGTQDTQVINEIKGHRDCVIDGTVVDVKSASSFSFKKFKNHTLQDDDAFGYVDQLGAYLYAAQDDPIVTNKDAAGFLVMDKTLGHICLDMYPKTEKNYDEFMARKKEMVVSDSPPPRGFDPIPEGASGNMGLPVNCQYCSYNKKCHPGLRKFIYSYGPKYLTTVKKVPNVPEVS